MRRTSSRPSLTLLLTAVALLLGVLGMHAVAGGPHTPRGAEGPMTSSAPGHGGVEMAEAVETSVVRLVGTVTAVGSDVARADLPTDPPMAMVALCVALLLSVVVALGLGTFSRVRVGGMPPHRLAAGSRRRELTRAPPPDLLTLLCVLRT